MEKKDHNHNKYIDNVLISLRREYSKDEIISALYKRLSDKDFEIGILKSDLSELKDELKQLNHVISNKDHQIKQLKDNNKDATKEARIQLKKDDIFNSLSTERDKLKSEVLHYKQLAKDCVCELILLKNGKK